MTSTVRRQIYATPVGVALGPLDQVADGAAKSFKLEMESGRFLGFVVRRGGRAIGYVDRCPHAGAPLGPAPDRYLTPDGARIGCFWHGALFDIETGDCTWGPCEGDHLRAWPIEVVDGEMITC